MKKKGFTLIEIMIVLMIVVTLSALFMPTIIQSIMKIEKEASIESAALTLRQFYIDARSKSLLNETIYTVEIIDDKSMTFTPAETENDTIRFSAPSGIRSDVSLRQDPEQNATYSYVLGIFTIYKNGVYKPIDKYSLTILINGEDQATVTVDKGYPKLEIIEGS